MNINSVITLTRQGANPLWVGFVILIILSIVWSFNSNAILIIGDTLKIDIVKIIIAPIILFIGMWVCYPKLYHNDYTLKYSYNLSLGGYVEFDVMIKDVNHKLDKEDITTVYKELRNIIKGVNFSNDRVELENGIKKAMFDTLNKKYKLSDDNKNNTVDVLITVI